MSFIQSVLKRIQGYFQSEPSSEVTDESWLCILLKRDSDFLFIHGPGGVWDLKPLMIKTDLMSAVETSVDRILKLLQDEFEILPERVAVEDEVISLYPLMSKQYSFAVVELNEPEFSELSQHLQVVSLPVISMHTDTNLFFNMVQKIVCN